MERELVDTEESDGEEEAGLSEQCFYASFKIYLGPPDLAAGDEWNDRLEGKFFVPGLVGRTSLCFVSSRHCYTIE